MTTACRGTHILIDGYGAPPGLLADRIHLTRALIEWQAALGLAVVSVPHVVSPGPMAGAETAGVAGHVTVGDMHLGFQTYPSRGFATIDVHLAGGAGESGAVIARLREIFGLAETEVFVQPLGPRPIFAPRMALVG